MKKGKLAGENAWDCYRKSNKTRLLFTRCGAVAVASPRVTSVLPHGNAQISFNITGWATVGSADARGNEITGAYSPI